jgi:BirA family transcriptional regulator, biotin operon repressor / biotin---[acetyl-CoA-carboxylase] ligase
MTMVKTFTWDGVNATTVAKLLDLHYVSMDAEVESTQDLAHARAEEGKPAGSLIVADAQRSGRGRQGKSWSSQPGRGVWCSIIERPSDASALGVLSLRIGLVLAEALDAFSMTRVGLKWPNDLRTRDGKLAGILTEARWSGATLAWVAIGVGVNVIAPDGVEDAAGLAPGTKRIDVLAAVVRAIRGAAHQTGALTSDELSRYAARDTLKGRRIVTPAAGTVAGVDHTGALLVETADGVERHRTGTVSYPETST